ncbi:hypothetical protein K7G81_12440 [Hephaestia sp. CMS5P-6]|nr:hypothetical protein [Hephaestia mangrovi]
MLERPEEAIAFYASKGVTSLVVEEKHIGSRALIVLARNQDVAARRFGVANDGRGVIVTRTGHRFFADIDIEAAALQRIDTAMESAGLWGDLNTDWVLWDAEIMPWSMKAGALIREQYAAVGAAATAGLEAAFAALETARARGVDVGTFADATARLDDALLYRSAYNRYVAPFTGIDDLRIAPFHLLASEGAVHDDKNHLWHMGSAHRLAAVDPTLIVATEHRKDRPTGCGASRGRNRLVGTTHRGGWRGHGRQAARLRGTRSEGLAPAGDQMSRPRVSADHLRSRVRPA